MREVSENGDDSIFVAWTNIYVISCPGYDIKLDLAVLLTSFGGLVAGRASRRKNSFYKP